MNAVFKDLPRLCDELKNGTYSPQLSHILRESLFYYCSGKDATPIVAFGADVPLYVYSDSFKHMSSDFESAIKTLYNTVKKRGYTAEAVQRLHAETLIPNCKNAELSLWKNDADEYFTLLYTQSDAVNLYETVYVSQNIRPKYFCNYRYEMSNRGIIEREEKRAEYILGHCHSPDFECVGEYEYLGDYSFDKNTKAKLYRRDTDF